MADDFGNDMDLPVGKDAVNRLIQENSAIFSDTHCKVCSAVLISESQKLAHYQSKKHANKYRRYMSIHQEEVITPPKKMRVHDTYTEHTPVDGLDKTKCCTLCNMTFSSPVVASSHYIGKIHSKNLKLKEQGGMSQDMPVVAKPVRVVPGTKRVDPNRFCHLCNAVFNNPQMAEQHYKGRKHEKQQTKHKLMSVYSSSGTTPPITTSIIPQSAGSGAIGNWYRCDTCDVVVNSIEQYQAHELGAKHTNNLKAMVTTHSPPTTQKSYGSLSSSFKMASKALPTSFPSYSLSTGGLSSSGGYSSMPSSFSFSSSSSYSRGLSSARSLDSSAGLLPLPSYNSGTNDGYNYYRPDY